MRRTAAWVWRTAVWIPVLTVFGVVSPLLFTSREFGSDWTIHLWLMWRQQLNIEHTSLPGYFVSGDYIGPYIFGVFYPILAFAGGPLYAFGGYLSLLTGGHVIGAYITLWILATAMAYAGFTWASHHAGLRGWRSQIAGAVYITGAYAVMDMYARGDLGEFVALSAIPLVLAGAWALLSAPRWRVRDAAGFAVGVIAFTGSHNITLLWGTTFMLITAAVVLVAVRPSRDLVWRRRTLAVVGFGVLAAGVNAWFLVPDLVYSTSTMIAKTNKAADSVAMGLDSFGMLFNPFRPGTTDLALGLRTAVPWIPVTWAVVVAARAWRSSRDAVAKRLFVGSLAVGCGFFVFALRDEPWALLPHLYRNSQFTWRLHGYVLLCAAFAMVFALRLMAAISRRATRNRSVAVLVVIVSFGLVMAVVQGWSQETHILTNTGPLPYPGDRSDVLDSPGKTPPAFYAVGEFRDSLPKVVKVADGRLLWIPPEAVMGSSFSGTLEAPEGHAPFLTNIGTSTRFVRVEGLEALGRDKTGLMVARRPADAPATGPIPITITMARPAPIVGGAVISVLSVLGLAAVLVGIAIAGRRRRRQDRSNAEPVRPTL